jgi:hypothetical protein
MYCPRCGAEYRQGFAACADCRVALVTYQPARPVRTPGGAGRDDGTEPYDGRIVELTRFPTRFEADVIIAKLHAAGVRVIIGPDDAGGWYPHVAVAQGHRVLVAEDDLDVANEVLAGPHRAAPVRRRRRRSSS